MPDLRPAPQRWCPVCATQLEHLESYILPMPDQDDPQMDRYRCPTGCSTWIAASEASDEDLRREENA